MCPTLAKCGDIKLKAHGPGAQGAERQNNKITIMQKDRGCNWEMHVIAVEA